MQKLISLIAPPLTALAVSVTSAAPTDTSSPRSDLSEFLQVCEEQCHPDAEISYPTNCDIAAGMTILPVVTLAWGNTGCECDGDSCVTDLANEVVEQCAGLMDVYVDFDSATGIHSYCVSEDPSGTPFGTAYVNPQLLTAPLFPLGGGVPYPCNNTSPPLSIRVDCLASCEVEIYMWCTDCAVGLFDCATRGD